MNADERKLGPPYYKYERSSTEGKCTNYMGHEIDYHYTSIDEYSKYDVYNENGIISKIQDFIEYSEEPYPVKELENYTLYLYKRNYDGFNLTCLGEQELNEESTKYVRKYENLIMLLNVVAAIGFLFSTLGIIYLLIEMHNEIKDGKSFYFKCKRNETCDILFFKFSFSGFLFGFVCATISCILSLNSINPIIKCTGFRIQSLDIENIIEIVIVGLCCLKLLIDIIFACVQLSRESLFYICRKISDCCNNQKEKKELAELGFTKEECQAELKSL
jgi:hypothetical protein